MTASANPMSGTLRAAGLLAVAVALSACGAKRQEVKPAPAPSPVVAPTQAPAPATKPAPATPKPASTAATKGDPEQRFAEIMQLMQTGQMDQAEEALRKLSADFPEFGGPFTNLGIIYGKSGRRAAALPTLERAVRANPKNAVAQNWLGMMYREARDFVKAERAYLTALDLKPDYGYAHLNLGLLYDNYLQRRSDALLHFKAYQKFGGAEDLRVLVWIAEIEAAQKAATQPPAAPASPPAVPAPATGTPAPTPAPVAP